MQRSTRDFYVKQSRTLDKLADLADADIALRLRALADDYRRRAEHGAPMPPACEPQSSGSERMN